MDERYSDWLRSVVLSDATWRTKLSELRRLESVYGDLDTLFDEDGLEAVLGEITYSRVDQRNKELNPSKLIIDGDTYNNLASYRSALRKYMTFRDELGSVEAGADARRAALRGTDPDDEDDLSPAPLTFGLEKDLQAALRANIAQIEPELEVIDGGAERNVPSGFIDILARDGDGKTVVIELKAVKAPLKALSQIAAYMGDIAEAEGTLPRGVLIATDFDAKLISAARSMPTLSLTRYHYSFTFEAVT